jgi:hypothetical protein
LAIVTLVLWVLAAAAGLSLLRAGGDSRRRAVQATAQQAAMQATARPDPLAGLAGVPAARVPEPQLTARLAAAQELTPSGAPRIGAVPLTPDGKPPPTPHARVTTPPGEHPLLEFSHPMLAVTGLATWFGFVLSHYAPMAWIAFGILLATMGAGLVWLTRNLQEARQHANAAWNFPRRLVAVHGLAVAFAITLTVLTALSASHA